MTTGKTIVLTRWTFVGKIISQLFNMLSRLVITFLPRSNLQSPSAVILESPKIKSITVSIVSPSICHEVMGPDAMILVFWMLSFKSSFSLSSFTFIKRLLSSSSLSAMRVVSSAYLRLLIFLPAIFLGGSEGKSVCLQCGRPRFHPWVGKIPWRRKWQPTPVLLPGKFHGWKNLIGYSPWGHKESDMTEWIYFHFLAIFIPACASSSPAFHMMYSAYKLNKQGDNTQPWHTPFPIWNQSVVPCPVLTVSSLPANRFLRRQGRLSGIPISFRIF